jgi:hypothetical protein
MLMFMSDWNDPNYKEMTQALCGLMGLSTRDALKAIRNMNWYDPSGVYQFLNGHCPQAPRSVSAPAGRFA